MVCKHVKPAPPGWRWVYCDVVIHYITKKPMRRKNGGKFKFLVRR